MSNKDTPKDDAKTRNIKNAQDRKDYSIAFYNATNSAIELVKVAHAIGEQLTPEIVKARIVEWREWFLDEHGKYRATVTDNIGATYNIGTAIDRMTATKTKEELQKVWLGLTQDERQDPEIHAKCMSLISQYETVKID